MGDQLSVHRSCCPVVVDPRENYFEAEQKKLVEKQTNSPYRHHRRSSSSITNHSPIPLFCSKPKKYTFYFAAFTPKYVKLENKKQQKNGKHSIFESPPISAPYVKDGNDDNDENKISLLQHGELQFKFDKNNVMSSPSTSVSFNNNLSILPPTIKFIAPPYLYDKFTHKMDVMTNAILLESVSNLTSIEWFYYGEAKKDTECVLIVSDAEFGLIHEIDSSFNITKPLAKICRQDNVGIVEILRFNNKYTMESDTDTNINTLNNGNDGDAENLKRIRERGYNITWSTTKDGELLFGSNGMKYNTSVIKYNRSRELLAEDWRANYNRIRYGVGAVYPGFIWIECILWSHIHDKWFILPRYCSINAPFHDKLYKNYGCNMMLTANENFQDIGIIPLDLKKAKYTNDAYIKSLYKNNDLIKDNIDKEAKIDYNEAKKFGIETMKDLNEEQKDFIDSIQRDVSKLLCYSDDGVCGFISAQFLAGTNDQLIMGIRVKEMNDGSIQTSVSVFNIHGDVFIDQHIINGNNGYNGLIIL